MELAQAGENGEKKMNKYEYAPQRKWQAKNEMKIKTAHRKISSPAIVCLHAKSKGTTTATAKKKYE